MNKRTFLIMALPLLICFSAFAQNEPQGNLKKLQNEIKALKNLKMQKLDALENAEAIRWNKRYEQNARTKQYEEHLQNLESSYSRMASDLNRRQEDLVRQGNETRELKSTFEEFQQISESFTSSILQDVNRAGDDLSRDIPLLLNERTLMLSDLSKKGQTKEAGANFLLRGYFDYLGTRFDLTTRQVVSQQMSIIGDNEYPVDRLQLGTVFVGEASREGQGKSQILLKTGKLQGQVYAWRHQLIGNFNQDLTELISQVKSGKDNVKVVLDVTQTKGFGVGFTAQKESEVASSLMTWFRSGGLVMYPLIAVALFGLLLAMERFLVIILKSTNSQKLMKRLEPFIAKKDWKRAQKECEASNTSLHRTLTSIFKKAEGSRPSAEKALQERLLREIPQLEKRMGLIAAIGGAAPLLGLLGTVSGMISLFKIITDVGTNDPRILAGGISEALVTTQTGLIIAIPLLLIHGFLSDRLDRLENDISSQSLTLLNKIWPQVN